MVCSSYLVINTVLSGLRDQDSSISRFVQIPSERLNTRMMMIKKTHEMLKSPIRALRLSCTCFNILIFGPTKEKILECEKAILKFWDSFVLQKHSYNGPNNAYSDKRVHLPPLFFSTMKVSPPVSDKIKGILHKASVDNFENSKPDVIYWERQILQQVRKLNPDARSTSYTVFVSQLPQYQEVQKVLVTKKSIVLKFPFDVEGGLCMIANGITGELQAHYNNGILVVYLIDDNVGLTLINAKDPSGGGKASEITQPKEVKKRRKY